MPWGPGFLRGAGLTQCHRECLCGLHRRLGPTSPGPASAREEGEQLLRSNCRVTLAWGRMACGLQAVPSGLVGKSGRASSELSVRSVCTVVRAEPPGPGDLCPGQQLACGTLGSLLCGFLVHSVSPTPQSRKGLVAVAHSWFYSLFTL